MKWFRKNGDAQTPSPLLIGHSALRGWSNYDGPQSDDHLPDNHHSADVLQSPQLEKSGGRPSAAVAGGWSGDGGRAADTDERLPHVPTEGVPMPTWLPAWKRAASDDERFSSGVFGRIGDQQVEAIKRRKGK